MLKKENVGHSTYSRTAVKTVMNPGLKHEGLQQPSVPSVNCK